MSAMGAISFCLEGCHTSWKRVSATLYAHLTTSSSYRVSWLRGTYPFRSAFAKCM
jgi:hypothetical protein